LYKCLVLVVLVILVALVILWALVVLVALVILVALVALVVLLEMNSAETLSSSTMGATPFHPHIEASTL
jgi:hypothetical protein